MIIPMRCFTCGKEIANLWPLYCEIVGDQRDTPTQDMKDQLNNRLRRICCKRMLVTHVELIDELLKYDRPDEEQSPTTDTTQ